MPDEEVEAKKPARKRGRPSKEAVATSNKTIVSRTLAIAKLGESQLRVLARFVGVSDADVSNPDGVAEVALRVVDDPFGAAEAVRAVASIATSGPLEAGVLATELAADPKMLRMAWRALADFAPPGMMPPNPPAGQGKAGLALAKAAISLDAEAKAELADILNVFL